ncbi:MAG: hypothetical protein HY265_03685 [Deltaproteobacteria bacterium]|nr:hypothetical protein [Deltaproteobacteria bacterium]
MSLKIAIDKQPPTETEIETYRKEMELKKRRMERCRIPVFTSSVCLIITMLAIDYYLNYIYPLSEPALVGGGLCVAFGVVVAILIFNEILLHIISLEKELVLIRDIDPHDWHDLLSRWEQDDTIAKYQTEVAQQGRSLIMAEFYAIKDWVDKRDTEAFIEKDRA